MATLGTLDSYGHTNSPIVTLMGAPGSGLNINKVGINAYGYNKTVEGGGSLLLFGY